MIKKECLCCKKTFDSSKKTTKYCCRSCQSRDLRIKNIIGVRKTTGSILICIICNKEFYVPKYRANNPKTKFCSRKCLAHDHLIKFSKYRFKKLNKPKHKYKNIKVNGVWMREHRHVMEVHLGRKLKSHEHIHHINDNSLDNRIENLLLLSNSEHQKIEYDFRKSLIDNS